MDQSEIFVRVREAFRQANIPIVMIGGFAINHYGVSRFTKDVDFLLAKSDYPKALAIFRSLGFSEGAVQPAFAQLKSSDPDIMNVDLMLVDQDTLEGIVKDSQPATLANQSFAVPSIEHLIALKLHAIKQYPAVREEKDLADIIRLIQQNDVLAEKAEFKDLCLTYGTKELYNKICARCQKK